jgi:hypothetical protein
VISSPPERLPLLRLAGLSVAALFIHGYHLGVEDCETYLPAAKKLLSPALYPFAPEFFLTHEHLSIFGSVVAETSRLTRIPIDWAILGWFLAGIFAMLVSCWMLARACFTSPRARWCATLVMTAVLAMPATNTALLLMDPYLTARSFSTPLTLFALGGLLERKYVRAGVATVLTGLFHPQMVVYLIALSVLLWAMERARAKTKLKEPLPVMASAIGILPAGFHLTPASGAYREALYTRDYFFLYNWQWYHWLGLLAPLAILGWFWRGKLRGTTPLFAKLSFAMLPFGLVSILAAMAISFSPDLDTFARLQPLRTFHLITIVFVVLIAGVLGEFVGKNRLWATGSLVTGLAVGMFFVARATYPNSSQIELPSSSSSNGWVRTLLWIRNNTPVDAVFAVDSRYLRDDDTDAHGFRAIAERSALADYYKDSGAASLFPQLAPEWKQMSEATYGLNHFNAQDFRRLKGEYAPVSWTVIHGSAPLGLACPYQESGYAVCRVP